ncbi:hypothetical protein D3C86_2131950 [compost metagenome]
MRTLGSLIKAALVGAFKMSSEPAVANRAPEVRDSHMAIVDAIAAHDLPAARHAMVQVIAVGRERARATYTAQHAV